MFQEEGLLLLPGEESLRLESILFGPAVRTGLGRVDDYLKGEELVQLCLGEVLAEQSGVDSGTHEHQSELLVPDIMLLTLIAAQQVFQGDHGEVTVQVSLVHLVQQHMGHLVHQTVIRQHLQEHSRGHEHYLALGTDTPVQAHHMHHPSRQLRVQGPQSGLPVEFLLHPTGQSLCGDATRLRHDSLERQLARFQETLLVQVLHQLGRFSRASVPTHDGHLVTRDAC